jgi:hypothetical protein
VIDFRYHIVSIVAIFLALAVGIVLGSGPLKDDIGGFLEDRTKILAQEKLDLQNQVNDIRGQVDAADQYAQLVQPNVVNGLLANDAVAIVVLPGARSQSADAVDEAVKEANGTVAGRYDLTSAWTDPDEQAVLNRVAQGLAHGPFADDTPTGEEVFAAAILTDSGRKAGQELTASTGVLTALAQTGFVKSSGDQVTRASSVIVVAPDTADADTSAEWRGLLSAMDDAGNGEVVAGPAASADDGGVVAEVRSSDLAERISTVDSLDTAAGVTTSVLALTDELRGRVGQYGTGQDASGPAPDPVPAN